MFEVVCLKCYGEENGPIVSVNRQVTDSDADKEELGSFAVEKVHCECGDPMYYVCTRNLPGISDGDYSHTSASLAINPCQTRAHKKLFPGVDVLSDGQIRFNSVKQQSDYCEKTGFDKATQKTRQKGVRIG